MRERIRQTFTITALVGLIGLVTPTAAMAAVLVVDDDGVQCPGAPYTTIQAAVTAASPGDTIKVCAGTYPEVAAGPLAINKPLTLLGAQDGVDARGLRGAESIIADIQGTSVAASPVVIDGFTVQNSSIAAFTGYGIWMNPGVSGTQVLNNIIQNNIVGIGLGGSDILIRHNLIRDNNVFPGGASGSGIYTDQFAGGQVTGVLIDSNTFINNDNAGVGFSSTDTLNPTSNIEVSNNSFDQNGRGVYFYNTNNATVHDNRITNSTTPTDGGTSVAVAAFGDVHGLRILNNDLLTGALRGIRVGSFLVNPNTAVEAHLNNIVGFSLAGLFVDPAGHSGTLEADCNWWGSATGPSHPNNATGTGDKVIDGPTFDVVDYTPWLLAPAPGGPCRGGLASTPGKVTGGGQLQGDPVFSPIGQLLSLPAIIVSANGTAQATFGFVIQFTAGASAPKGNLEYEDHGASIRIKATSYDFLLIDDGDCGTNTHALFTGTAKVNGVTESLTVEVNDCGEPGTVGPMPDTFRIQTDSYSNVGPLIGGNIQIHR